MQCTVDIEAKFVYYSQKLLCKTHKLKWQQTQLKGHIALLSLIYTSSPIQGGYEAVSGWGPGFDLGPKNVYFGETYFKDLNRDTHIFGLITKM